MRSAGISRVCPLPWLPAFPAAGAGRFPEEEGSRSIVRRCRHGPGSVLLCRFPCSGDQQLLAGPRCGLGVTAAFADLSPSLVASALTGGCGAPAALPAALHPQGPAPYSQGCPEGTAPTPQPAPPMAELKIAELPQELTEPGIPNRELGWTGFCRKGESSPNLTMQKNGQFSAPLCFATILINALFDTGMDIHV